MDSFVLAAIIVAVTASSTRDGACFPLIARYFKYLSAILTAWKKVSGLYSFLTLKISMS